ncbi:lecithin retinol acyltransferase family protein [Nocardioides mangrovi]|uniref:Lecithin retinol acyltransferase family protein n=1 Tax=Nocardioides mangrovi TaxID=2874580 RepID=A0ABS7UIY7_9ACTN|nr:lecithin retinol acyltransferase family protein [Nocardioides mangrovi]MBZ5740562.1 lecithin retinol acyltransferase family protein [Nocardioides mangrovi]
MPRGDHVYVRRRHYSHHGIDCGDGTVIHFARVRRAFREVERRVERTSLEGFARGRRVRVRTYRTRLPIEQIIRNAESKLGARGYSLVRNNCEHLATWATTGSPSSGQVRRWAVFAPGALASASIVDGGLHVLLVTLGMALLAVVRLPRVR